MNKATIEYAKKYGFKLNHDEKLKVLEIIPLNNKTPICTYNINLRKGYTFKSAAKRMPASIKQELPYWADSDRSLKRVIKFISSEMENLKRK